MIAQNVGWSCVPSDVPVAALCGTGISSGDIVCARPSLPFSTGPNIFVLVIGDPNGRWRQQCLQTRSRPCARLQASLRANGIDGRVVEGPLVPVFVGFVCDAGLEVCARRFF